MEKEDEIAENFNKYFIESIKDINKNIICDNNCPNFLSYIAPVLNKFEFKAINIRKLKEIFKKVRNKNFIDNINGKVLNDAILNPIFATEFCNLINEILVTGQVPKDWKISTIVPIEKVNKAQKAVDFRPINMLPVYEKILEIVAKDQLVEFCDENKILIKEQAGFRSNHSCETSINKVISGWKSDIDDSKVIVCVFLDFKRAFETIDRDILLKKLEIYGISQNSLKIFKSYLSDRKQQTKFNGFFSTQEGCDIGLPQGSVLSPLLFILYVNDVINVIKNCSINLFADDTLLYCAADSLEEAVIKVNEDLGKIFE